MYKSMKILIGKKFYKTAEQAQNKLDVFFACNRLTDDEYKMPVKMKVEVFIGSVSAELLEYKRN